MTVHKFTKAVYMPVEQWVKEFEDRSVSGSKPHGWCSGSLQAKQGDSCHECGQDIRKVRKPRNIDSRLISPHTQVCAEKGLYLIRLGAINGQGDWIKIGSSQNMLSRLLDHLKDVKHEYCEVLQLTEHSGHWKTVEGFEALINGRLRSESFERFGEEYFAYSDSAVSRAVELMESPQLLFDDLLDKSA